jgi:uncharacterized membrane protein YedE/YeeE
MRLLTMLVAGLLFGAGLALSGMVLPEKVIGFLDVSGHWDPSLIFVMVGALVVHCIAVRVILRRPAPLFDTRFHLSALRTVDRPLVAGAAIFGIGWGLGGFCPGPSLVVLGAGTLPAIVFVTAMAAGMGVQHVIARRAR